MANLLSEEHNLSSNTSLHGPAPLCKLCSRFLSDVWSIAGPDLGEQNGWKLQTTNPVRRPSRIGGKNAHIPSSFEHVASSEILRRSGRTCRLCNYLYHEFESYSPIDDHVEESALELKVIPSASPWTTDFSASLNGRTLNFNLYFRDDEKTRTALRDASTSRFPRIPPGRCLAHHPKSKACRDLALTWLDECISQHASCRGKNDGYLPKRVIDVGPPDGSEDPVLMISHGQASPYVALSYCWGNPSAMLTTTKSTISTRQKGIPLDSLPRTLQDAVWVTRAMKIRYLWIDALCIIQDSADDWKEQAAVMGKIYAGAALTIYSSSAGDSQSGFLHERSISWRDVCCKLGEGLASEYDIHVRPARDYGTEKIPRIATRAWTMQEKFLSKRILYYDEDGIAWECLEMTETEWSSAGQATSRGGVGSMAKVLFSDHGKGQVPGKRQPITSTPNSHSRWMSIVEQYSILQLSVESDRLPALAAIAEKYSDKLEYLAGVWNEHLPLELMWRSSSAATAKRAKNRIPSWSWASIHGPISYSGRSANGNCVFYSLGGRGTQWFAEVLSARVWGSQYQYLGQVSGGELEISGYLEKVFCSAGEFWGETSTSLGGSGCIENLAWMDFDPSVNRSCWAMLMGMAPMWEGGSHFYYLLLRKVDAERFIYQRCGIGVLCYEEKSAPKIGQSHVITII